MSEHSGTEILSSKLTIPRAADTVPRERLLSMVNQTVSKRLTTIVAGAGYGKTTLMAQAASSWCMKTIWYRLDESDGDPVTFMSYLLAGVRKHHPNFGPFTTCLLREGRHPSNGLKRITRAFLGELEDALREDVVIVLDDYHCVIESLEIKEIIEVLLRDLSLRAHLVLISRSELPLPLARLRAMREVIDIRQKDLSFTFEEIERLCTEIFGFSLDLTKIEAIQQKTGGWISGLILLAHSLNGKLPAQIQTDILSLKSSRSAIFTYLDENIYRALTREKQDFLIRTSLFLRINAPFCDRLLNTDRSLGTLKYLEENHLFTSSDDNGWYSYHQLFREFLQIRLKDEMERESILELHRNGAAILEVNEAKDEAPCRCLNAEKHKRAFSPLDSHTDLFRTSPPSLKICMFGKFRVLIGENELPAESWKSRKARSLFQFLAYSRSRGYLNKEALMELLWPEEDPALTVKRLHVALASLRKTLDPGMVNGAPSPYVSRAGNSYRVNIGPEGRIDIEAFSEMLKQARQEKNPDKSIGHLLNAASLYDGDFMEEEPYSEWCFEVRERFRRDYLAAVERIVAYYERQGNYLRCIEFAERYLACDRCAEAIYRSLLISYWKTGDKLKMARTFKRCRDSIMKELNSGLSEETELLYRDLVENRQAKAS